MTDERIESIAARLLQARTDAVTLAPISADDPGFDMDDAYAVLDVLAGRRRAEGWVPVGRKVGFTNRTLWELYRVSAPFWTHLWDRTVHHAPDGVASISLDGFVQPRIEPEVVFGLRAPVTTFDDAAAVLASVEWLAPGFEIVQCHYPGWRFTLPDCTASFGLHGALIVGPHVAVDQADRGALASLLATFEATLSKDGDVAGRGVGSNVLDSPALALAHAARVIAEQPDADPLVAGEIVTTGSITDAFPVAAGETWISDYGALGLDGVQLTFT
jgi:2-oxo-3-hexenedioate decarboxylase